MQRATIVAVCLLLGACGDKPAENGSAGEGQHDSSKALTPQELADALSRVGGGNEEARKKIEEAAARLSEQMGGDLATLGEKARALGERALTAADVETYIALAPAMRLASGKPDEMRKAVTDRGLSLPEWSIINGRIMAARMALRLPPGKGDAKFAADVETVRPYADRIDAAHRAR